MWVVTHQFMTHLLYANLFVYMFYSNTAYTLAVTFNEVQLEFDEIR
jgi:hypothetical protein